MATSVLEAQQACQLPAVRGAEYHLFGQAKAGGPYNSHLVSAVVFIALAAVGTINMWFTIWIVVCIVAAFLLDRRSWRRKLVLRAIPGQMALYGQVLVHAVWDALPFYVLAYLAYVCVAPIFRQADVAVSSFVILYAFYMILRAWWLVYYLWLLKFRWESAGRTFQVHEANLKNRTLAMQHVLWSYFLGNVGLVIRCAAQVVTIGGLEYLRRRLGMDLTQHPLLRQHLVLICVVATIIWLALLWPAIQRALLIYYRTHRTFHSRRPLYDSIHSIHHRGVLPTPLDSGTISPAEFLITEMAIPAATIVPNWWWTFNQLVIAIAGHLPSHNAGTRYKFPQHHLHHHRLFTVNFGLTPAEDTRYGTLYFKSEEAVDGSMQDVALS